MSRKRKRTGDDGRRKAPHKPARRPSPSTLPDVVYLVRQIDPTNGEIWYHTETDWDTYDDGDVVGVYERRDVRTLAIIRTLRE